MTNKPIRFSVNEPLEKASTKTFGKRALSICVFVYRRMNGQNHQCVPPEANSAGQQQTQYVGCVKLGDM